VGGLADNRIGAAWVFSAQGSTPSTSRDRETRNPPTPPSTQDQSRRAYYQTNDELCSNALSVDKSGWNQKSDYAPYVAEAGRRGLTIDACRKPVGPLESAQTGNPPAGQDFSALCASVLNSERTALNKNASDYAVIEAAKNGLTVDACRQLLERKRADSGSGAMQAEKFTNDIAVTVVTVREPFINGKCLVAPPFPGTFEGDRIKGVPDDQWCNAIQIRTNDINRTSALLYYAMICTAYGRNSTFLGEGNSRIEAPDIHTNRPPLDFHDIRSFGTGGSIVRIPNVKVKDVSRVECHPFIK
jgi:hypothetical protein